MSWTGLILQKGREDTWELRYPGKYFTFCVALRSYAAKIAMDAEHTRAAELDSPDPVQICPLFMMCKFSIPSIRRAAAVALLAQPQQQWQAQDLLWRLDSKL